MFIQMETCHSNWYHFASVLFKKCIIKYILKEHLKGKSMLDQITSVSLKYTYAAAGHSGESSCKHQLYKGAEVPNKAV